MKRFLLGKANPEAYKAMIALDHYVKSAGLDPIQGELIKIRASQINGCAYCINSHTKDARKLGETEQRIYLLNAWKESPQFTEEERIILAMTEEVTLISQQGLTETTYQKAVSLFGEPKTGAILMAIITINAWNRIGVSLHMQPE